jgi:DNA-binding NtrC family response regulator
VIYLDEISALPRHDQLFVASLIDRVAETGAKRRVDSVQICASVVGDVRSSGLEISLVRHFELGRIQVPNLEARREDIPALATALCAQLALDLGGDEPIGLTDAAMKALSAREWKRNLHEMKTVLERAVQREWGALLSYESILLALEETAMPSLSPRGQRDRNQKDELQWLIEETGCNVSEISRRLNLSRGAIYYRANKFGLEIG